MRVQPFPRTHPQRRPVTKTHSRLLLLYVLPVCKYRAASMTRASVPAKLRFRKEPSLRPTAREEGKKEQRAMNDRLLQSKPAEILAEPWVGPPLPPPTPPPPPPPPHPALMSLNHPRLTLRAAPSWHHGWHRFGWHGDRPLSEREAFSRPWTGKSR